MTTPLARSAARFPARPSLTVVTLTALAFGLRLVRLGVPSLWHDEAISALLALRSPGEIVALTAQDVHPPLYYVALHVWTLLGHDEFALRLLSVLASTLTVPVLYGLALALFPSLAERQALAGIGALLFALAPFQIFYAQEARMYALFVLLCSGASWLLLRSLRTDGRWQHWLAYALLSAVALYTDYFAVFLLAAHGVWVAWLTLRGRGAFLKRWLGAGLVVLILYAPWLPTFYVQTRAVGANYWVAAPSLLAPLLTLHLFLVGHALPIWLLPLGLFLSLFTVAIMVFVCLRARHGPARMSLFLLILYLMAPIGATFAISQVRSLYLDRALLFVSPALYILVAWTALSVQPRLVGRALLALLVALMVAGQLTYQLDPAYTKYPLRTVATFLDNSVDPQDIVLHTSDGSFLPDRFYAPQMQQALLPDAPDEVTNNAPSQSIVWALGGEPQPLEQAIRGRQRVWLVVMLDHAAEHQRALRDQLAARALKSGQWDIGGIQVYLFETQPSARLALP